MWAWEAAQCLVPAAGPGISMGQPAGMVPRAEHEVSRQGRRIARSPPGATIPGLGAQCQKSPWRARSEHPSAAVFIQGFT